MTSLGHVSSIFYQAEVGLWPDAMPPRGGGIGTHFPRLFLPCFLAFSSIFSSISSLTSFLYHPTVLLRPLSSRRQSVFCRHLWVLPVTPPTEQLVVETVSLIHFYNPSPSWTGNRFYEHCQACRGRAGWWRIISQSQIRKPLLPFTPEQDTTFCPCDKSVPKISVSVFMPWIWGLFKIRLFFSLPTSV